MSRARKWRSTTAGPSRSIACQSWRPIWCAGRSRSLPRPQASPRRWRPKVQQRRFPLCSLSPENPVKFGLVPSLARPEGNLTGINLLSLELTAKRLELLRKMLLAAARVAELANPANTTNAQITLREVEGGCQLANWAARHALPMTSGSRDICEVGGLMSYATNVDTYR